jgi:lipoprotein-releasing system ATP-binding protein
MSTQPHTVLQAQGITKYFNDPVTVEVLQSVSFSVQSGEFVSITGKSGCGKSTLLYILSTMDTDYKGDLFIDGISMRGKTEAELAQVRNEKIGFVFQFHYLLNEFSVLRNVMLPGLKLAKYSDQEVEHRAMECLKRLDIGQLALKKVNDPILIMGDEPTGNLDKKNTDIVFDLFQRLSTELGQSLLVVTHDPEFAAKTQRNIVMEDGKIVH